jgi:acetoin utilization deacetylase AcuC-like enzyme
MKIYHYDSFGFPLPPDHRFPVNKYALLRERLLETGILSPDALEVAPAATAEQLSLVHTPEYIAQVFEGRLDDKEIRRMGLPWSPQLVERVRRSVGATIAAAEAALLDGIAASLGGGTHHAFPDHGQGFCIFNDVAVAARWVQVCSGKEHRVGVQQPTSRVVVIDCDVHQGNGTAFIFEDDPSVYTFSIHGQKNFPFHKETSDLDIGLPDGTGDEDYLDALESALDKVLAMGPFDLAFYLAGADPYAGDRLGRMRLSKAGLARRDRLVLETCREYRLPVAITMSGGYAHQVEDIAQIHAETIRIALKLFKEE